MSQSVYCMRFRARLRSGGYTSISIRRFREADLNENDRFFCEFNNLNLSDLYLCSAVEPFCKIKVSRFVDTLFMFNFRIK